MTFFQYQKYFSLASGLKTTLDFDQILSSRTTTSSVTAGCWNSHDIDVVDLGQIDILAHV